VVSGRDDVIDRNDIKYWRPWLFSQLRHHPYTAASAVLDGEFHMDEGYAVMVGPYVIAYEPTPDMAIGHSDALTTLLVDLCGS